MSSIQESIMAKSTMTNEYGYVLVDLCYDLYANGGHMKVIDTIQIGQQFGDWVVIDKEPGTSQEVMVRCRCGLEVIRQLNCLRAGKSLSCHRCALNPYDPGKKIGMLTIVEFLGKLPGERGGRPTGAWLSKCDCGGERIVRAHDLTQKKQKPVNCGCLSERQGNHQWKGYEGIPGNIWNRSRIGAKSRGYDFTITIEEAWDLFVKQEGKCALTRWPINFPRTCKLNGTASLDRIDNSKGYIPGNIQWLHKDVNRCKWDHDQDYFIQLCKAVADTCSTGAQFAIYTRKYTFKVNNDE